MLERRYNLLETLWDDCDLELRSDIAALAAKEVDGLPSSELSVARQRSLESRGFGAASGKRMRSSCRLMARYADQQAPAVADVQRLFGSQDAFEANIRNLLELRFRQLAVGGIDKTLAGYVQSAIRDLEPNPELALKWVRSIANRALSLIWEAEIGADPVIPRDWIAD